MRAVVAAGGGDLVRLVEVAAPVPGDMSELASESSNTAASPSLRGDGEGIVLVDVSAISVNRGELHRLREARNGWRPGWDFAGTVAASGTSAFAPGQRVFGISGNGGAWADQVAVPAEQLAALPAGLADERAAALPVAALTACRVLRLAGGLTDRRVLVTGAAGGVGRFAVQLAAAAGARVSAVVRDAERASGLAELGAGTVVTRMAALTGDYDLVLESAGGESLTRALDLVGRGGLVVSFGNSARVPASLPVGSFYPKQAVLRGYHLLADIRTHPPAGDLAWLAGLATEGQLTIDLDTVRDIDALPGVLRALAERRIAGKAVLRMRGTAGTPR